MKKIKILLIYALIILLSVMLMSSCAKKQEKPAPKSENEPKQMPPVVDEIEGEIISIMSEIDMVSYYRRQIDMQKEKEKEKKDLAIKLGTGAQESSQGKEEEGKEKEKEASTSQVDSLIKFEPDPITINDILLSEVLKAEATDKKENGSKEIPTDIVFIWHGINTKVTGLHKKWNMLESHVTKSGASPEAIKGFENTLNNLTISASQYNYLDSLFYANKLTSYIPDLINNFKKKVPSPIYFMKYHLRQIILDCRIKDYEKAGKNYSKLVIYKDALVSQLVEKKLTELANKLNTSVKDLEAALKLQDLNIIKIKASVLMSNIEAIKEEVAK
ncbi:hypothetical protein R9X47_27890 [Wukongibacter baidiensis]|uniref:hypothetical protein n=1 Tax=Wukongibacter baidiensis TaxID=1723361 RepID=UPI003D7F4657